MLTPEDDEVFVQNERSTEVSTVTIPVPNEVIMEIDVPSTPAFAPTLYTELHFSEACSGGG